MGGGGCIEHAHQLPGIHAIRLTGSLSAGCVGKLHAGPGRDREYYLFAAGAGQRQELIRDVLVNRAGAPFGVVERLAVVHCACFIYMIG